MSNERKGDGYPGASWVSGWSRILCQSQKRDTERTLTSVFICELLGMQVISRRINDRAYNIRVWVEKEKEMMKEMPNRTAGAQEED